MIKKKIKILIVFGTRPEAIKMAPLVKEFKKNSKFFNTKVCVTAQHREMLDQVLKFFEIKPDYDLDLMRPNQNLYGLTASIINGIKPILERLVPEYVFVHGDTTTSMATSIGAFYSGAKICHVEAGLRTHNKNFPYPEEINRQIVTRICDFHFAPTENSKLNLIQENIKEDKIFVTGNTVIDALLQSIDYIKKNPSNLVNRLSDQFCNKDIILVTGHRRENHGEKLINICEALKIIAQKNKDLLIIYPVHLNPRVKDPVKEALEDIKNIILINPLSYQDFIWLMNRAKIILTDSGGIQEEAPSLGKPVLVMRDTTERPEAVNEGTVLLVGANTNKIINETLDLLKDRERYQKMSKLHNPYGDGLACKRIVKTIINIEKN